MALFQSAPDLAPDPVGVTTWQAAKVSDARSANASRTNTEHRKPTAAIFRAICLCLASLRRITLIITYLKICLPPTPESLNVTDCGSLLPSGTFKVQVGSLSSGSRRDKRVWNCPIRMFTRVAPDGTNSTEL